MNAITARVSPGEAQRLASNPAVAEVVPDEPIPLVGSVPSLDASGSRLTPLPGACSAGSTVQLDPQAVELIHAASQSGKGATAQALGYTGAGVTVAYIADGVNPNNPDFIRANGQHVFVDYQDFSNTGSQGITSGGEAFIDSSSIAAQGLHIYNVSSYGVGLNRPCQFGSSGVAPGASLVGLERLWIADQAFNSVFLEAINYAVNVDHVNVINESFGDNPFPDQGSLDLVADGRRRRRRGRRHGHRVDRRCRDHRNHRVAGDRSERDFGRRIHHLPRLCPDRDLAASRSRASTAGSTTTSAGSARAALPRTDPRSTWWGRVTSTGRCARQTPTTTPPARTTPASRASVELSGGTSEAAPLTAGRRGPGHPGLRANHGGIDPSPAVVKQIITSTAQDINAPADQQGAGLLDAYQAVLAAESFPGSTGPARGAALLAGANQLHATGLPGTPQRLTDTISNDRSRSQTIALSSRTLGAYQTVSTATADLSDATGNLAVLHFTVPPGQARLDGSIAFVGAGPTSDLAARVNLSLIDPTGKLAEYNLPQGTGNFSDAQVADPVAGTWTAFISSAPSADGGTTGAILFEARVARWTSFGTITPTSVTLAPGASRAVTLTVSTPATPGDQAGSIVASSDASEPDFARVMNIPVTLRSLIPAPPQTTTFSGIFAGGNGRQQSEAQSNFYQLQVPAGLQSLDVTVTGPNTSDEFVAELIDPATGEAASTAANALLGISSSGGFSASPQTGAQLHALAPDAGLWTLAIDWYGQTSGTALFQPFTVTVSSAGPPASAAGLPHSPSAKLAAGTPVTVQVKVKNTGSVPEEYFIDSRLNTSTVYNLPSQTSSSVQVPVPGIPPLYWVPSHTTSITASASASAPIFFDYWWYFGDPDLSSTSPPLSGNPTGTFNSSSVAGGLWAITPFQNGPDGPKPLPPITAATSMTATSRTFDPTITSPTGDLWLNSINPANVINPVLVEPGQTASIPVTIVPTGTTGSTVRGTLFLDDASLAAGDVTWVVEALSPAPEASDVASFPYAYTIK